MVEIDPPLTRLVTAGYLIRELRADRLRDTTPSTLVEEMVFGENKPIVIVAIFIKAPEIDTKNIRGTAQRQGRDPDSVSGVHRIGTADRLRVGCS